MLAVVLLAGCARSTTIPDAGFDTGPEDAGLPDAGPIDAGCDISPVPDGLPVLTGGFQTIDRDAGITPPVQTGGDPRGVWVFEAATFWVERDAMTMFNPFASSVSGTAWIAVDDTAFRLDYELVTTLSGTAAGTIVRATSTRVHARYRVDREQLEPIGLVCSESSGGTTGDPGRVTFTVVGDRITVSTELAASTGPVVMVLEGVRRP